jgi:hypothetical protein
MSRAGLLLACVLLLSAPGARAASPPDDRSVQLFEYTCASPLGRRQVVLFANGTVRLREGEPGKEAMGLGELNSEELRGAIARLGEEKLSEIEQLPRGVDGDWVESCVLDLTLADRPARSFRFQRYDTLPLPLSRVLKVVEDCAEKVGGVQSKEHLPEGYEPHPGDVLKRTDGEKFEVIAFTADKKGVELWGVDQPLTLYVLLEQMGREFVALVSRAHP